MLTYQNFYLNIKLNIIDDFYRHPCVSVRVCVRGTLVSMLFMEYLYMIDINKYVMYFMLPLIDSPVAKKHKVNVLRDFFFNAQGKVFVPGSILQFSFLNNSPEKYLTVLFSCSSIGFLWYFIYKLPDVCKYFKPLKPLTTF